MTASGPFAMGPALGGTSARRTAPRSNFAPIVPQGPGGAARLGAGLTQTTAPTLKREPKDGDGVPPGDDEVYSDPDEGVEIVDMENVRQMDWMAPESLRKEKETGKKKVKKEEKGEARAKSAFIQLVFCCRMANGRTQARLRRRLWMWTGQKHQKRSR